MMRVRHEAGPGPRQTFCGPAAISIITGETAEEAARCINLFRNAPLDEKVKGTYTSEITRALDFFGFECQEVERPKGKWGKVNYDYWWHEQPTDRFYRPTVTSLLPKMEPGEVYWIGTAGHWFVIKDGRAYDNARPGGWDITKPGAKYRRGRVWNLVRVREVSQKSL